MFQNSDNRFRILVFEQNKSGRSKVKGIQEIASGLFSISRQEIESSLPTVLDETMAYLPQKIEADLVLDYLKHPDLSLDLAVVCKKLGIPVVASGRKLLNKWAWTPPVCCALPRSARCGLYSEMFGYPEFEVELEDDRIRGIRVKRGAPCGATWKCVEKLPGMRSTEAVKKIGLQLQFSCTANPAGWDPIKGKSPVHLAADIHAAALKLALIKASRRK
ncbi:MAG: DUF166 domain-containing protein [Desulfohalobiaceae bacterium]|nr:DUF166 domain-containing protein [Desulfohalobiaceae bacterium]